MQGSQVAIVAGVVLAIGFGIGIAVAPMFSSDEDSSEVVSQDAEEAKELKQRVDDLRSDLEQARSESETALKKEQDEVAKLRMTIKSRDDELEKARESIGELEAAKGRLEAAASTSQEEPVEEVAKTLTPEELEQARALSDDIIQMVADGKDKKEILAKHAELLKLGMPAADMIYAAFEKINEKGNPWDPEKNSLELLAPEFFRILSPELYNNAIDNVGAEGIPDSASIYGAWAVGFSTQSPADDADRIIGMIRKSKSRSVQTQAFSVIQSVLKGSETNGLLLEFALNGSNEPDLRARAISTLDVEKLTDMEWEKLRSLANDANEGIQQAVRIAESTANPSATGLMVMSLTDESVGATAGIKPGDILTNYNGTAITSMGSLYQAMQQANGATVGITVMRGDQELRLTMGPGDPGLTTVAVTKE